MAGVYPRKKTPIAGLWTRSRGWTFAPGCAYSTPNFTVLVHVYSKHPWVPTTALIVSELWTNTLPPPPLSGTMDYTGKTSACPELYGATRLDAFRYTHRCGCHCTCWVATRMLFYDPLVTSVLGPLHKSCPSEALITMFSYFVLVLERPLRLEILSITQPWCLTLFLWLQ